MENSRVEELIKIMSVEEKALLCSGRKFWYTRGIKKYGIEPYMVSDGPHGLRKQADNADNLGINNSVKATCFPSACVMASSWDKDLVYGVGKRIGEEAKEEKVGIVLGPGVNIKRSPLCGRNFEYYSEDPYLSGTLAGNFIKGVQSNGVGTSLKHFAVNNQEQDRLRIDSVVDERALREIYLASFENAVRIGHPYTVMCSYNSVNGTFASENSYLLTQILRKEWGFDGYVMTDWGASNNRIDGLNSGLDLEMPGGSGESTKEIVEAVNNGSIDMEVLNDAVRRLLTINFKISEKKSNTFKYSRDDHHEYARKVASEGAVLLKNEKYMFHGNTKAIQKQFLPLDKKEKLVIIGGLAEKMRYQGSGSSLINPHKIVTPLEALKNNNINFKYAEGYSVYSDEVDKAKMDEALKLANNNDCKIVVFAGLTMFYESEGFDRKHLRLPTNQNVLIEKLIKQKKRFAVVLFGGAPVELPWLKDVSAVLNMYLPGEAGGEATVDLLFGDVNPSGKLAETYPISIEDIPCYHNFPEGPKTVEYRESIYVGYRYYQTANKKVLFPFGFGLSYTDFEYSNLKVEKGEYNNIKVCFSIKNIGKQKGKEIAEIYVQAPESNIFRPKTELKDYIKVELSPNESKDIEVELNGRSFAYYDTEMQDWNIIPGNYAILVGASSEDIRLKGEVPLEGEEPEIIYDKEKLTDYFKPNGTYSDAQFAMLYNRVIPTKEYDKTSLSMFSSLEEARSTFGGNLFAGILLHFICGKKTDDENAKITSNFMREMLKGNSLRSFATTSGGMLPKSGMVGLIEMFNGKFFKGLRHVIKSVIENMKYDKHLKKIEEGKI